jgi:hypothetical protein
MLLVNNLEVPQECKIVIFSLLNLMVVDQEAIIMEDHLSKSQAVVEVLITQLIFQTTALV